MVSILTFTETINILIPLYLIGLLLLIIFGLFEWGIDNILGDYRIVNWIRGDFPGIEPKGLAGWIALITFYLIVSFLIALMIKKIGINKKQTKASLQSLYKK
jgi:hypothetical protein